jgi:hypothetical protein
MKHHTLSKLALAAGMLLGGAAAQAQNVIILNAPEATAAAARAAMQASAEAAKRGQRVGMITGRLNPQPQMQADGTVGQELDASTMMYSVARIGADGQVERLCISGSETADKAVRAPAFAKRITLNHTPRAQEIVHASK